MRTLFLLLLLVNLAFFAWAHYLVQPDSGTDPRPLTRQIDPQKLPIVTPPKPASNAPAPAQVPGASGGRAGAAGDVPRHERK